MKITRRCLFFVTIILFFSTPIVGQEISEQLCMNVFDLIEQSAKPEKIYRRETYKTDCVFDFKTVEKTRVFISIEKYKTDKESRKSLTEDLDQFLDFKDKSLLKTLKTHNYWNEEIIYGPDKNDDNFILLRKNTFLIEILSNNFELLTTLEKVLRGNKFE